MRLVLPLLQPHLSASVFRLNHRLTEVIPRTTFMSLAPKDPTQKQLALNYFKHKALQELESLCRRNPFRYLKRKFLYFRLNILSYPWQWLLLFKQPWHCFIFRKICLKESFAILGHEFVVGRTTSSRLFREYVQFVADHMKELVFVPSTVATKMKLPVPFSMSYNNAGFIIDAFETFMEKPSDPTEQALTYSMYQGANTIKHHLSITPNGSINFHSKGYGGRISDELLTSVSGFLEVLMPNTAVMAIRGFKKIKNFLYQNNVPLFAHQVFRKRKSSVKKKFYSRAERAIRRIAHKRVSIFFSFFLHKIWAHKSFWCML